MCYARSRSVVALRRFGLCHVSRCGRHNHYRAGETQNPLEVQKCSKCSTNVMRDNLLFFIDFFFFPSICFCVGSDVEWRSFSHFILCRWHIFPGLNQQWSCYFTTRATPPILRPLPFAFYPSCACTPHCFAVFCFSLPEQRSVPVM